MGVSGIFHTFGWSIGPLVGGLPLYDSLVSQPILWGSIAAIGFVSAGGLYVARQTGPG